MRQSAQSLRRDELTRIAGAGEVKTAPGASRKLGTRKRVEHTEVCNMLQVTFRQTLPSESLIALARTLFAEWPAPPAGEDDDLRCHVTIDGEHAQPCSPGRFRVRVEVQPGSRHELFHLG